MKKKASHVGLVLSFVIFVTFVFFVFTILNPAVKKERGKEIVLGAVKENIIEKISSNLSSTSLKVKDTTVIEESCFEISGIPEITSENTVVKGEENNLVGFTVEENRRIRINNIVAKFFKIYLSKEFITESGGREVCDLLTEDEYTLGSARTTNYVFENKINELLLKYDDNYTGLKDDLGVTEDTNFGISFTNSSEDEIQKGFESVSGNVYIEEIPIQYYNNLADIKSGSIKIRIW